MPSRETEIVFTPQFFISLAVALLLIPLPLLFGWLVAAVIHELSHCAMLHLCRCRIFAVRIGTFGAEIVTEELSNRQAFFCALAGPVGGLLPVLFVKWVPVIALCGVLQSAFNLLPLFPMDGGRVVESIAKHFLPEKTAMKLCSILEIGILTVLILGIIYLTWRYSLGLFPLTAVCLLLLRRGKIKISCKPRHLRVQ